MESLSYNLCFAWHGDYDSLKNFFRDELKLDGVWEQPGGDKKIFSTADISICWRKNKNLLHIAGEKEAEYKKLFCSKIIENVCPQATSTDGSSQTEKVVLQSTKADDIDDLRSGQELNRVAIQSLSHSVEHLAEIISQFRKEMDSNQQYLVDKKSRSEINEAFTDPNEAEEFAIQALSNESLIKTKSDVNGDGSGLLTGPINEPSDAIESTQSLYDESLITPESSKTKMSKTVETDVETDNVNLKHKHNVNNPIVSAEVATSIKYDNKQVRNINQATFAEVVTSSPPFNTRNALEKSPTNKSQNNSQPIINDPSSDSADGFIGVDRRHYRVKKFLLSGIAENVKECQIVSYLKQRNITPIYISVFPSKRKGTTSAKIHFRSADCSLVQQQNFWPQFVNCKIWQSKGEIRSNITHNGKFSTYV